jgi:hypothetical protein
LHSNNAFFLQFTHKGFEQQCDEFFLLPSNCLPSRQLLCYLPASVTDNVTHFCPMELIILGHDLTLFGRDAYFLIRKIELNGKTLDHDGLSKFHCDKQQRWMKLTQPVMIQSFSDEFDLPNEKVCIPTKQGEIMSKMTEFH